MSASDRALRRLVADLARARPADIEAVLDTLADDHRASVERLLAEFRGEKIVPLAAVVSDPAPIIEGLAPWRLARLERRSQAAGTRAGMFGEMVGEEARLAGLHYAITDTAFETLRVCAADLKPATRTVGGSPAREIVRRRLFGRRAS